MFAVSGWADGYSDAVCRLLANLSVPRKGLIGPWGHAYPHLGAPGPAIDFLRECLRWWDRWLKDVDSGVEADPMLRVWMQDSAAPTTSAGIRPGRWVAEPAWPSPRLVSTTFALEPLRLRAPDEPPPPDDEPLVLQSPLPLGLFAGKWCSYAVAPDVPHDQRQEDGGALVFDSEPLAEPLELFGCAQATILLSSDRPVAMIAARLSDVRSNGEVTRVTYGVLNLTHRDGSEAPEPLPPGRRYRVTVPLNGTAQTFPNGHRIRLARSTPYWPLAWPTPRKVRLTVHPAGSRLVLPVRPPRDGDDALRDLGEEWYRSVANDYGSIRGETRWTRSLARGTWRVRTEARTVLTSDAEAFYLRAELDAHEGDTCVYSRNWSQRIARDLA